MCVRGVLVFLPVSPLLCPEGRAGARRMPASLPLVEVRLPTLGRGLGVWQLQLVDPSVSAPEVSWLGGIPQDACCPPAELSRSAGPSLRQLAPR